MTNKKKIVGLLLSAVLLISTYSLTLKFFNNKKYKDIIKYSIVTDELNQHLITII